MSMYLPNPDVRATGYEGGEFLDIPPMAESERPEPGPDGTDDHDDGQRRQEGPEAPGEG